MADTAQGGGDGQASRNLVLGSSLLVAAFFANTLQSVLGRFAEKQLTPEMFTWITFLTATLILLPFIAGRGFRDLRTKRLPFHILRGTTGIASFILFITSARLVSIVNANVLVNTTPFFIPLLSLAMGVKVDRRIWLAVAVGFIGIILILQPDATFHGAVMNPGRFVDGLAMRFGQAVSPASGSVDLGTVVRSNLGSIAGLAAGFLIAIEFLCVKNLDETESSITQMAYFLVIGLILSSLLVAGKMQSISADVALIALATGGCLALFQFLLIKAYGYAQPHEIGVFQYSSIIFAAVLGLIFFQEIPDVTDILGALFIASGGMLTIYQPNSNGQH